jgi:hypothetical protein
MERLSIEDAEGMLSEWDGRFEHVERYVKCTTYVLLYQMLYESVLLKFTFFTRVSETA